MSKRTGLACVLLLAAAFLVWNRASYKGFFTDDDFDNLSWTRNSLAVDFFKGVLTPRFQTNNFRPVGQFFYHEEARFFGFDFPKYLAAVHLIHLFNAWLLWWLIRRLGAKAVPAAAACAFFALHLGYFEAVWKPAYIFDVLCATFCLLSMISFSRGRWILSFLCFWLAYKAKEPAVMLPFVLACYEFWFGDRRWKVLIPFFLAAFSFGLQALAHNTNDGNQYAFHFTIEALARTAVFYAGRVFLVPYLGFALLALPFVVPNRRVWFGLAAMLLLFFPLLFLPGRIETGYCYLPFAGLAIAFAGVAELGRPAFLALFFLLWTPLELRELRAARRDKLARDDDARAWVTAWNRYAVNPTAPDAIIYSGAPFGFGGWGMDGAIKCAYPDRSLDIRANDSPSLPADRARVAFLTWNSSLHRLDVVEHTAQTPDAFYIDTTAATPVWQLEDGWYGPESGFRWIAPRASARIMRPQQGIPEPFELRVLVTAPVLQETGWVTVTVSLNNQQLEPRRLTQPGWQTVEWLIPPDIEGAIHVVVQTDPAFHPTTDPRTLGIAVGSFGFR